MVTVVQIIVIPRKTPLRGGAAKIERCGRAIDQ
jgi:hypothetical protein